MKNTVLFLGDSFTWGEGLELYTNTSKWKAERLIENNWEDLSLKQDVDGIAFRESNRFPSIVGNSMNFNVIVDINNGGSLNSFIQLAEQNLYKPFNSIDTIIIQLTTFDRGMYHLTTQCKCDVCINSEYKNIFPEMYTVLEKIYKSETLSKSDLFLLNFFQKKLKISITDSSFFNKLYELKINWYREIFNIFYSEYINKWKSNGERSIYFIDSWDELSSEIMGEFIDKEDIIPLIGYDDKKYINWKDWEKTFTFKRIISEFPATKNEHPTLMQHTYIGNSIINFLKSQKKFGNIKKISYI